MGALHEGHLSLMEEGLERADHLVVSIFVNPTQFGPDSDFEDYPRELQRDREKCREVGAELIFAPTEAVMYAEDHATTVSVEGLDGVMCGPDRPGHFEGVTTIVAKLFGVVEPDVAVFGRKDYQQLAIIRRMVRDLNMGVEIVGGQTVREPDGLAVSSRNRYLGEQERVDARALSEGLAGAWEAYQKGERDAEAVVERARRRLLESVEPEAIDYVECVHPTSLERWTDQEGSIAEEEGAVVAMAVQVGEARLIDNLRLDGPLPVELE
jgi:pantoate--beta-alanine ligase